MKGKLKKITSLILAIVIIIGMSAFNAEAGTTDGNFNTPKCTEITTNGARISVRFSARTYVRTAGYFISTSRDTIVNVKKLQSNCKPTVVENINGYVAKGTELYYSPTSRVGRLNWLKPGKTYYVVFYYTDQNYNYRFSSIFKFRTENSIISYTINTVKNVVNVINNAVARTTRDYRKIMRGIKFRSDIAKETNNIGNNCSVLSSSAVVAFYNDLNSVSSLYDSMKAYNGRFSTGENWMRWGQFSLTSKTITNNDAFLKELYNQLAKGPVVIGRPGHYGVCVACLSTNPNSLSEADFVIFDYQTSMKQGFNYRLEYTLSEWKKECHLVPNQIVYYNS